MTTKWAKQNAVAAKICENCDDLVYALASATLTQSLVQVAHPILSAMKVVQQQGSEAGTKQLASTASFVLIDADSKTSIPVNRESDLLLSARTAAAAAVRGVVSFLEPSDTVTGATTSSSSSSSSSASSLQKGEVMQTPQQLSQYHMMVIVTLKLYKRLQFR